MNKAGLISEVSRRTEIAPSDVSRVLEAILAVVRDTVVKGQKVVLSGFGTFERRRRNPRTGRNPHTGEAVPIPARTVPSFGPGKAFRESVAAPRRRTRKPVSRKGATRR